MATRVEWAVEYEIDNNESELIRFPNEEAARHYASLSPTDRGLRRRYVTEWEQVD